MLCKALLLPAILVVPNMIAQTWACGPPSRQVKRAEGGEVEYPWFSEPDDTPSDVATTGYFINHIGINVRNVTESIDWYKKAFGLRHMFTEHVSEHFAIAFIGHSQGGRNGSGYQTNEELNRQKNNMDSLIEMVQLDFEGWNLPSGLKAPNTFSHIGMLVPDPADTQARLEAMGANIVKGAGETFKMEAWFADGTGFTQAGDAISPEEMETIMKSLVPLNTPPLYVADPDGNMIEVQPQEGYVGNSQD